MLPSEWMVNQHRDSIASYIGHNNLLEFFSIAENEAKARVKFNLQKVRYVVTCCASSALLSDFVVDFLG